MNEKSKEKFIVLVDDNFHYLEESDLYKLGDFNTYEEAGLASKKIVDDFLTDAYTQVKTAEELYARFVAFGETPWISSGFTKPERFLAWPYAKLRCEELFTQNSRSAKTGP